MESATILGCKISIITLSELNNYIISKVKDNVKEAVLNVNINCINLAQKYGWIKDLLNNTNIVFCDGDGVRLGAAIMGINIPEKITYNRWIWKLADISSIFRLDKYEIIPLSPSFLIALPNAIGIIG